MIKNFNTLIFWIVITFLFSLNCYSQCNIVDYEIDELDLSERRSFCIKKNHILNLGDLRPSIYFECLSEEINEDSSSYKFLLVQTVPKLKSVTGDINGEIFLVREEKKKYFVLESSPILKVKILDFNDHRYDLQETYNALSLSNKEYAGFLIYSKGLIPHFIKIGDKLGKK